MCVCVSVCVCVCVFVCLCDGCQCGSLRPFYPTTHTHTHTHTCGQCHISMYVCPPKVCGGAGGGVYGKATFSHHVPRVDQNYIYIYIYIYIYGVYTLYLAEKSPYTVIYGVNIQFWPTLHIPVCYKHRTLHIPVCYKHRTLHIPVCYKHRTLHIPVCYKHRITAHLLPILLTGRVGLNHLYIRCIHGVFGREIIENTVIYGVYTVFLAGRSLNIRSYTVYTRYFWQGNH